MSEPDDLYARIAQMLYDLRFAEQIEGDSARVIVCPPGWEHAIRAAIDQLGVRRDLHRVTPSPLAVDCFYVIDEQAIEADLRETMQRSAKTAQDRYTREVQYRLGMVGSSVFDPKAIFRIIGT